MSAWCQERTRTRRSTFQKMRFADAAELQSTFRFGFQHTLRKASPLGRAPNKEKQSPCWVTFVRPTPTLTLRHQQGARGRWISAEWGLVVHVDKCVRRGLDPCPRLRIRLVSRA